MKLGILLDWASANAAFPVERVRLAERLGFDSVWSAEAYGSDALTPLAYLAALTTRIRLGTGVMQLAARSPAATAMAIATLDKLAGEGRVIAGLGVSGPQIVEGWYGQPWGRPVHRMRDYVEIMRKVLARQAPLAHEGREISLPYRGAGATGLGKALKSILHPSRDIPIWLGTGSPAAVELTAEIADGWLPFGFVPGSMATYGPWLEAGFCRAGSGRSIADLEIQASCHVLVTDDVRKAIDGLKPFVAFYVGGMGHKTKNFHREMMARRGYTQAAERIQELFLAGRRDEAVKVVPDEYIDEGALIGPLPRIRERFRAWESSGVTGLTLVTDSPEAMELIAGLAGTRG